MNSPMDCKGRLQFINTILRHIALYYPTFVSLEDVTHLRRESQKLSVEAGGSDETLGSPSGSSTTLKGEEDAPKKVTVFLNPLLSDDFAQNSIHSLDYGSHRLGDTPTLVVLTALFHRRLRLMSVDLSGNGLSNRSGKLIGRFLSNTANLQELILSENNLGEEGGTSLCRSIETYGLALRFLDLSRLGLGEKSMIALGQSLSSSCHNLEKLCLLYNRISGIGAKALADGLSRTRMLKKLYLSGNPLGSEGFQHIVRAVFPDAPSRRASDERTRHSLIELDELRAAFCLIDDGGASAIAHSLGFNTSLRLLDLSMNAISSRGGEMIFAALLKHPSIRSLDFFGNTALSQNHCWNNILKLVNQSQSLRHLNMYNTGMKAHSIRLLLKAFEKNTKLRLVHVGPARDPKIFKEFMRLFSDRYTKQQED
eukprot:TRINITY_DN19749_c0_g1_i2.p1 TRINITY_DN19749_c0_g1~~TRINITY_DN19749_c0_g1_i2.p1  ORF type:complete len:463 (+),score=85.44 TRINITY_DN19749_c0_g1_i2:118-1389(+)